MVSLGGPFSLGLYSSLTSQRMVRWSAGVAALLLAFLCMPSAAHAQGPQCTFSVTNISFGTIDPASGNAYDAAGTLTYACTGDSREIVRICPSWGLANDGTRWLTDASGDKLFYNLYTDPDRHTVWGSWYSKAAKGPSIDVPLGRPERAGGSVTIYARTNAHQESVATGSYTGVMDRGNAAITYGYASKGSCESMRGGPKTSVGLTVSATVGGKAAPGAITAPDATKPNPGAAGGSTQTMPAQPAQKKSLMDKLKENAEYQENQRKNQAESGGAPANSDASSAENRAKYLETHACLTTDGADKANALADECKKVTSDSNKGCNVQENSCEEIRKTTQKGCWGLGASAPDFCFTKYR